MANEPLKAGQAAILARMHGLRATTLQGHRMRARVFFARSPEIADRDALEEWQGSQLEWVLVRDLVEGVS